MQGQTKRDRQKQGQRQKQRARKKKKKKKKEKKKKKKKKEKKKKVLTNALIFSSRLLKIGEIKNTTECAAISFPAVRVSDVINR